MCVYVPRLSKALTEKSYFYICASPTTKILIVIPIVCWKSQHYKRTKLNKHLLEILQFLLFATVWNGYQISGNLSKQAMLMVKLNLNGQYWLVGHMICIVLNVFKSSLLYSTTSMFDTKYSCDLKFSFPFNWWCLSEYATYISHLLTTFNGSINVFIYFGKHKRDFMRSCVGIITTYSIPTSPRVLADTEMVTVLSINAQKCLQYFPHIFCPHWW